MAFKKAAIALALAGLSSVSFAGVSLVVNTEAGAIGVGGEVKALQKSSLRLIDDKAIEGLYSINSLIDKIPVAHQIKASDRFGVFVCNTGSSPSSVSLMASEPSTPGVAADLSKISVVAAGSADGKVTISENECVQVALKFNVSMDQIAGRTQYLAAEVSNATIHPNLGFQVALNGEIGKVELIGTVSGDQLRLTNSGKRPIRIRSIWDGAQRHPIPFSQHINAGAEGVITLTPELAEVVSRLAKTNQLFVDDAGNNRVPVGIPVGNALLEPAARSVSLADVQPPMDRSERLIAAKKKAGPEALAKR